MKAVGTQTDNSLPLDLLRFISSHIQSVEQLEILCLLVESPDRTWTVDEIFSQIQSTPGSVLSCLQHLARHELLSGDPQNGFRFRPAGAELAEWACHLAHTYRKRRVTVIGSIYQKPEAT